MRSALFAVIGATVGLWIGSSCALVCLIAVADSYFHGNTAERQQIGTFVYLACLIPPAVLGGTLGYVIGRNRRR